MDSVAHHLLEEYRGGTTARQPASYPKNQRRLVRGRIEDESDKCTFAEV